MHVIRRRGWEIPESLATPEHLFFDRRAFLAATGATIAGAAALSLAPGTARAQRISDLPDPTAGLYPAKRNEKYVLDRPVTEEKINTSYNNFYEFGSTKNVVRASQALKLRPWTVKLDGMVEKEQELDIDDLLKKVSLEERLYRHRCVEAWSMAIPWSGFPMAKLVEMAKPLSSAKYVRMETFFDKAMAPEQRKPYYPWPYIEGLTMAEATNELTFMVTGAYGKPLAKQNGSPLRLATPWKYGFKSTKGIQHFIFTDERPKTYWMALGPDEYGFWANVNPKVPHPRWSQSSEEILGTGERVPTQLYNGYGEQVAMLYSGIQNERLFM